MRQEFGDFNSLTILLFRNLLLATHPLYNVGVPAALEAKKYFEKLTVPVPSLL